MKALKKIWGIITALFNVLIIEPIMAFIVNIVESKESGDWEDVD